MPAGVVTMNSRVHCREEASGKDYHLTLVYPQDAGGEGRVSILAPVGSALLGLSVGQHIDWPAPGGRQLKLTLLAVGISRRPPASCVEVRRAAAGLSLPQRGGTHRLRSCSAARKSSSSRASWLAVLSSTGWLVRRTRELPNWCSRA